MSLSWDIFENMNAYVYVIDADTRELIYLNAKSREAYSTPNREDYAGRSCYEVVQNGAAPCAMCNTQNIQPGGFVESEAYNPILDKPLSQHTTIIEDDGRRLRLDIAFDVSQSVLQRHSEATYRSLEAISNEAIRVALNAPTPDQGLNIILEYLGRALHADRTYIVERDERHYNTNTYEWTAAGVTPEIDNLQNLPPYICANWYRKFHINESIFIEDVEDIREADPAIYQTLKPQNIHSIVVVPLYDSGKVLGFYGVDNPPAELMDYAKDLLQIVAQFIISTLRRRNLLLQLNEMSYHDQLTHFGNRYAMELAASQLVADKCVGVVYCDISGLKHVNDTQGHKAGDRLILSACECLARVFGDFQMFRIGGDELLVFCPEITEAALDERVERLRADLDEHNVAMAVGVGWYEAAGTNIDCLLNDSERLMYEDKAEYYRRTGLDRRR